MIPNMDDPMGEYWNQPRDIQSAPIDGEYALLTQDQVDQLAEYSSSFPSGVYPGKCWKRNEAGNWMLVWYGDEATNHMCPIVFRKILIA